LLLCCSYLLLNYQFFAQRPQQISYLFFVIELIIIYKFLVENKNYLFFLIPIVYLWTNIHASFFLGILICLVYSGFCFLGIFGKNKKHWLKKSTILFLITLGMIASSILPPQKFGSYQDLILMFKNNYIMRTVFREWTPLYNYLFLTIFYSTLMFISLLTFLIVTIRKKVFTKSIWLLPLLAFIPTAYFALRNLFYGHLVATIIVGWAISHIKWSKNKIIIGVILFLVVIIIESFPVVVNLKATYYEWPEKAADFILKENIQGNMFNQFTYGDYLEYRLYPTQKVFMDSRAEPFFCCELKDFYTLQINSNKSLNKFQGIFNSFFDKYNFSYAVLVTKNDPSGIEISTLLGKNPLWFLVYKDDLSEIWVKKDGLNNTLLKNLSAKQLQQLGSSDLNIFSDVSMNITFNFPKKFKIYRVNPSIIAISEESDKNAQDMLFIFSSTLPKNESTFNMPFATNGNLKSNAIITVRDFSANQAVYSDGKNETNFLVLRKNQQVIVMRIPQNSKNLEDAINNFIDSIKLLN
jgi:hypothetical protein